MKKMILKGISVIAAFFLGIVFMGMYMEAGSGDLAVSLGKSTLPLVWMEGNGERVNLTRGHEERMDGAYMRDAVVALPEDLQVRFFLEQTETDIQSISYEVRTVDTSRLVEDGTIEDYGLKDDNIEGSVILKDLLDEGEKYLLTLIVQVGEDKYLYYYTHILNETNNEVEKCVEFAREFHEATFDKNNTFAITKYIETDRSTASDNLDYVNIHSKYNQIIWGDMNVKKEGEIELYLTEIEGTVTSLRMEYIVSHTLETGYVEYYEIEESYRLNYANKRIYLIDYERTMERIFNGNNENFRKNSIELGILNEEVEYVQNEEENIIGFVQNGNLWCYDISQNKLSSVLELQDPMNSRESDKEHEIEVLKMEETGDMYFLVCGYINKGLREGYTGIGFYHYDALANTIEEMFFVPSKKPYEVLKTEIGNTMYFNTSGKLYFTLNERVYEIKMDDLSMRDMLEKELSEGCYMATGDGKLLAWHENNTEYEETNISVQNLDTGYKYEIEAEPGTKIRGFGFMGEDFIYGIAKEEDILRNLAGEVVFPMETVVIRSNRGQVIQEFSYPEVGKYVVDISVEENRMDLSCVIKNESGEYVPALPEPITNKSIEVESKIQLKEKTSSIKEREYFFTFEDNIIEEEPSLLSPKQVLVEGNRTLTMEELQEEKDVYYVYGYKGYLDQAFTKENEAIQFAHETMGQVVDNTQNLIWKRGQDYVSVNISDIEVNVLRDDVTSLAKGLDIVLNYEGNYGQVEEYLENGFTAYEILEKFMKEDVLDLSGCSLDMVLYYVAKRTPVIARTGINDSMLIVGYDQSNVMLLDPMTGKREKMGKQDATEFFEECGNIFVAYQRFREHI